MGDGFVKDVPAADSNARRGIRSRIQAGKLPGKAVMAVGMLFVAVGLVTIPMKAQSASAPSLPAPATSAAESTESSGTATQSKRRPDSVVAADVTKKLMASEALRPLNLGVWVHNGTATLTGVVPTPELRTQAEELVKSVDGIHKVDDQITIGNPRESTPGNSPGSGPGPCPPAGGNASSTPNQTHPPLPAQITLPAGTPAYVMIMQSIDSRHTHPGDTFRGILMQDIMNQNGFIAVPKGAQFMGTVVDARGPGHLKGHPKLALQLTGVEIADADYPLMSEVWARGGPGKGSQSAMTVGGSAAAGAIVGGAVGGGGTAALGGLLGGLGGAGLSALSSGPQLLVPAESVLTFYLKEPLTVRTPTSGEIRMLSSRVPPQANRYGIERAPSPSGPYGPGYPHPTGPYPPSGYYPPPQQIPGAPPGGFPY